MDIENKSYQSFEMNWSNNIVNYLEKIKKYCSEKSIAHNKASNKNKLYYTILAIPCILLPLVSSAITPFLDGEDNSIFQPVILTSIGILNSVSSFFNFGKNTALHSEYGNKYNDIVENIDLTLIKDIESRPKNWELYVESIKAEKQKLDDNAPPL